MTAKEKALELFDRFQWKGDVARMSLDNSKQCALICVDEILEECLDIKESYWQEVKQEINKL